MARVVILGNTPATRYFLRQGLGVQQVEVVGLAPGPDRGNLAYDYEYGSAASRFRGTVEVREDAVVLAGRYGRGGLRHDTIALFDGADVPPEASAPDAVVIAPDWDREIPADLLKASPRLIAFGTPRIPGAPDLTHVPPATLWTARTIAAAIRSPIATASLTTWGGAATWGGTGEPGSARAASLRSRGNAVGQAAHPWTADLNGNALVGIDLGPASGDDDVTTSVLHLGLAEETDADAVLRRLKSAARRSRLDLRTDPVGSRDASGSPAPVIDCSAVRASGRSVVVPFFCDARTVEASLACDLVTSPS
jgi:hypothetical protein